MEEEVEETAERVLRAALTAKGDSDETLRRQVHAEAVNVARAQRGSSSLDPELADFVKAVALHSNEANVGALSKKGMSDDFIFEVAVVSAVSAGLFRMQEGLKAVRSK